MGVHLQNTPENWVFNTSHFSNRDVEKIFAAIQADKETVGPFQILVKPRLGHERAVRYICGYLFKRIRGNKAKEILLLHNAAKN